MSCISAKLSGNFLLHVTTKNGWEKQQVLLRHICFYFDCFNVLQNTKSCWISLKPTWIERTLSKTSNLDVVEWSDGAPCVALNTFSAQKDSKQMPCLAKQSPYCSLLRNLSLTLSLLEVSYSETCMQSRKGTCLFIIAVSDI